MPECEEGRFHLQALWPGKGFDFTGSACFDFVLSWDITSLSISLSYNMSYFHAPSHNEGATLRF